METMNTAEAMLALAADRTMALDAAWNRARLSDVSSIERIRGLKGAYLRAARVTSARAKAVR